MWLNVINTAPVAVAEVAYSVGEDETRVVDAPGILENDSDADIEAEDTLYAELMTTVNHGVLLFGEDGSFQYTPKANYTGSNGFWYRVTDGMAYSSTVYVPITVVPGSVADLDVADAGSEEPWLNEPTEDASGAYLPLEGTSLAASILAHATGMSGYTRILTWDPTQINVLDANGVPFSSGTLGLIESDGDVSFDATATAEFAGSGELTLAVYDSSSGFVAQDAIKVEAWTAKLYWVRFTSDHDVLRKGSDNRLQAYERYSSTEYYWDHAKNAATVNAPISQTAGTKVQLQLMLAVKGIPANASFQIDGMGRDGNGAALPTLTFSKGNITQPGNTVVVSLDANANLSSALVDLRAKIDWTVTYAGETKAVATSGEHRILTTIGAPPANPSAETIGPVTIPASARWATVARLVRAQEEVNRARATIAGDGPLPALSPEGELVRLARQISKQQKFTFAVSLNTLPEKLAWGVDPATGANCITLAFYVDYIGTVMGMGNFAAKSYIASTAMTNGIVTSVNPNVAVEGTYNIPGSYWRDPTRAEKLTLRDRQGARNAFEGTLVFTPVIAGATNGTTWYIPAGVELLTRAYKDTGTAAGQRGPDKVLTVMQALVWWNQRTGTYQEEHPYTQAADDLGP